MHSDAVLYAQVLVRTSCVVLDHENRNNRERNEMLIIHRGLADAIIGQALAELPHECCGMLAGPEGSGVPTRRIAMDNAARSESFFRFDSRQQLRVMRGMERRREEVVAIYHSHTRGQAYPSRTDIEHAVDPKLHYLIVSADGGKEPGLRSFRICNGRVVEERIVVVSAYRDARLNLRMDVGMPVPAAAA